MEFVELYIVTHCQVLISHHTYLNQWQCLHNLEISKDSFTFLELLRRLLWFPSGPLLGILQMMVGNLKSGLDTSLEWW